MTKQGVEELAKRRDLMEVARLAVEDVLIDLRESRISTVRGNGLVVREKDGSPSSIIRLGMEDAIRIGLEAIAEHLGAAS